MAWWKRTERGPAVTPEKKSLPEGVWTKCESCSAILLNADLEANLQVCPRAASMRRLVPASALPLSSMRAASGRLLPIPRVPIHSILLISSATRTA